LGLPTLLLVLYVVLIPSPSVSQIQLQGDIGYIAEGYDFTILNLSPDGQITRKSVLTLPYWVKNFTIENKRAYVITGDNSIHIIDVNDPFIPQRLSEWNSPGIVHSIAISGGFAYIANDSDGVQILSVNEPSSPHEIMLINNLGTVLDVATSQNLIYLARGLDGLDIYDMSGLRQSVSKGHYKTDGSINRITLLPENRALLLVNNNQVQIINFGNLQNIGLESSFPLENEIAHAVLSGKKILIAQKRAGLLIGEIKDNGKLEKPITISFPLYNVLDVAAIDNAIFIAAGPGGLQSADISKLDDIQFKHRYSRFWKSKLFIVLLIVAVLLFWLSFFAQFVLPVQKFSDRQKIFSRLLIYFLGRHGPALFIENGVIKEHSGERLKKGPGVVWLDSASAAVTRTAAAVKNTIGPGVYFTESNEYLAGSLDLHDQLQTLGPPESEDPFSPKPQENTDDPEFETKKSKYKQIQESRKQVSGLTRDGIEVVPTISVIFRVDTKPPEGGHPGSLFGYRFSGRKEDRLHEQNDQKAIEKAIIVGEGINPIFSPHSLHHRVPWIQLPALLAVDIWREYLAKFTLDELFRSVQAAPPHQPPQREPFEEFDELSWPLQMSGKRDTLQEAVAGILTEITNFITTITISLEEKKGNQAEQSSVESISSSLKVSGNSKSKKKTGLQVINDMIKARLTQATVNNMDEHGRFRLGTIKSNEYDLLQKRGLRVINVSVGNLRFENTVEEQFIRQWKATWLNNAEAERTQIDSQLSYVETNGQIQAIRQYAESLSRELMIKKPSGITESLKTLILRSRFEIINRDRLRKNMSIELQDMEEIIKWVEENVL